MAPAEGKWMSAPAVPPHVTLLRVAESLPILLALEQEGGTLSDLAARTSSSLSLASYHLDRLEAAGLASSEEGRWTITPRGRRILARPLAKTLREAGR